MVDSSLQRLQASTQVVLETAEIELVQKYGARHVNLSASGITAAAQLPAHGDIVHEALDWAQRKSKKGSNRKMVAIKAVGHLAVEFARHMLDTVDGDVSLEVDGRLAHKRRPTIDRARELVDHLGEAGVDTSRVLVKIPATWEGIEAAKTLHEKSGIRCHMTLVFGIHQLAGCADAGATIIAPAVGRITDWHKKDQGVEGYPADRDPGVLMALRMERYLREHGYASQLMPGTFRGVEQALALSECGMLSLPPKLLAILDDDGAVASPVSSSDPADARLTVDSATFQAMHGADPVATSKLLSGVKNLSWAVVSQENQLADWITAHQDRAAKTSTLALFRIWDYDGDGYIDREEWCGTEEVFNALDRDNNGRISLEEMAIGLGAPYTPEE